MLSILLAILPLCGVVSHTMINYHRCPGALEENRTPVVFGFVYACSHLDTEFKGVTTSVDKHGTITVCVLMEGCHATIVIENDSGTCFIDFFSSREDIKVDQFKKFFDDYLHAESVKKLHVNRDKTFSFSA